MQWSEERLKDLEYKAHPVKRVVELLLKSKRPLIHIGQGVRHAREEFFRLIKRYSIPFITARNGNDLVESSYPLYIGRPGTFAQRGANFAVQLSDLYLAIGTRLSLTQTGYNSKDYARSAQIIQVDVDPMELAKGTLRDPISIRQDSKEFLTELLKALEGKSLPDWSIWLQRCQYLRDKYPVCLPEYKEQKEYVNSYFLLDKLSEMANETDQIITDMGFAFQNTHQVWKTKEGQRLFTNCGLAPMGWGLPAAVGAAVATGRRTLCITGEGGLMMNLQELATVAHHQLPIKIFVLNNGGYLTIKQTQQFGFEGRLMGVNKDTGLSFPDFCSIAHSFGIPYFNFSNHRELEDNLAMNLDWITKPILCEVMMDPNQPQAPRALNRRNSDGTMNPTKLEDAYPFLSEEEVREAMSTDFWIETTGGTTWRYS